MKLKPLMLSLLLLITSTYVAFSTASSVDYLAKPTGKNGIGFQDFHWINTNICPDPNYNKTNKYDFSDENKKFCHEIVVRIYYPAAISHEIRESYYQPLVKSIDKDLAQIPGVTKAMLLQLKQLKSYAAKNPSVASGRKYPVIIFSPGLGSPVQLYENFIVQLVSHGYIVVGINSTFISGDIQLPNGHVVKFNVDESLKELYQISPDDFAYTYKKIHELRKSVTLFKAMDLDHVGALGQSLGGEIVANIAHAHPSWFQAAATLDAGIEKNDDTLNKFSIPFMREISASRSSEEPYITDDFELEKNGYLVVISPSKEIEDYSYHMNFTDYSTLQYLPAEKLAIAYFKNQNKKPLLGTGNGYEITNSINTYLITFFDTYLHGETNADLKQCNALATNTFIRCGSVDNPEGGK